MSIQYSPEIEIRVLGSLMHIEDGSLLAAQKAFLLLNESCFYKRETREIYFLIKKCYDNHCLFSALNIRDLLNDDKEVDQMVYDFFMDAIKDEWISLRNLEKDVESLVSWSIVRKQLYLAKKMINETESEPLSHNANQKIITGMASIAGVKSRNSTSGLSMEEFIDNELSGIYDLYKPIPTNIDYIDTALEGGVYSKSLIIIAGASGVGKTYFGLYFMRQLGLSLPDKQLLFFSLEMQDFLIHRRYKTLISGKPLKYMNKDEHFKTHLEMMKNPMIVYDDQMPDIESIEIMCRIKSLEKPIGVIVVDYLGLVQSNKKFERKDLEQAEIAQRLAALSMELNCIVIGLTQVNRNSSKRDVDDRCPYPSDAADSSGGLRSSTLWIGIDRPELHSPEPRYKNQFVVKCRKNRNGQNFDVIFNFKDGVFTQCSQETQGVYTPKRTFKKQG